MNTKKSATPKSNANPKYIVALSILATRSLNELEAFNLYGETCLHSTISTLWNNKGIGFDRVLEPHTHRARGKTHFMRYTLQKRHRAKALNLLQHYNIEVGL